MSAFLSELGRRAPHIALAFLAARKGGPMALAALEGGMADARQRQEATARQAQLDEERRAAQAAQEARLANADTRADEQAARAEEAARIHRVQSALQYLDRYAQQQGETAPDAASAENALLGRASSLESMFNVPQGQLSSAVPNMAPAISRRQKKLAEETYARAEKTYGAEAMANDSITLTVEPFGQVKPSQLRSIFMAPAVTATGEPAKPFVKPERVDTPNTPEERMADALRRGDTAEAKILQDAARKLDEARRDPRDPVLAELAQMRLDQQRNAPQLPPAKQRRVDSLVKGFDAQPAVKNAQKMAESVSFANSLDINTKNPADDQGLIYAFAKAMDPDSVVREGEYATVQKYAQSWAERFGFNATRIFTNTQFLTPEARANMKATIMAKFKAGQGQYENLRKSYADRINKTTGGADGDTYLTDYGGAFPGEPAQGGDWIDASDGVRIREKK